MRERGRTRGSFEDFMGEGPQISDGGAEPAPPPIGPLVGETGERGELPPAYARIVRRVLTLDVEDAFEKVTAALRRGKTPAHRAEYGDIVDELDELSEVHMLAHQLAANAAVKVARYTADLEVLQSDMRAQAVAALNKEREEAVAGDKKAPKPKQINESDVKSRMAGSYPAEFRRLESLLAEAKAVQKFIAELPEQCAQKRRELDGRVRTVRKG